MIGYRVWAITRKACSGNNTWWLDREKTYQSPLRLFSIMSWSSYCWHSGINQAAQYNMDSRTPSPVPPVIASPFNEAGFHSVKDLSQHLPGMQSRNIMDWAKNQVNYIEPTIIVAGAVFLGGTVVEGEYGYRSTEAMIQSLFMPYRPIPITDQIQEMLDYYEIEFIKSQINY